jgi:hypothetical protein
MRFGWRALAVGLGVVVMPAAGCTRPTVSTIVGHVTMGPMCPVERPDVPCPDAPVKRALVTAAARDLAVAGYTDDTGAYRLRLPASGTFRLDVRTGTTPPTCPTVPVEAPRNETLTQDIHCDSGIR